ncbi:MAG: Ig-like domain repeat protein [Nitrososphaerales archaeon]
MHKSIMESEALNQVPGAESVSATLTYSVSSPTSGVTVTSAACGCSEVTPAGPSTTSLSGYLTSVAVGSPTTVSASVQGTEPTGTVTFSSSGSGTFSPANSCTLSSEDACSVSYTPTSASGSPVTITANYGGDGSNLASSAATTPITITGGSPVSTSTSVSCSPTSIAVGEISNCTATVLGSSPTGTVTFSTVGSGSVSLSSSSCTLASGSCYVNATGTSNGTVTVDAAYSGDSNNKASSGQTLLTIANVMKHKTITTITSSSGILSRGGSTTLTVTVTEAGISPVAPTGKVTWSSGGHGSFNSASCTLAPISSSQSQCSVTYTAPVQGHGVKITAKYLGDSMHRPSHGIAKFKITKHGALAQDSLIASVERRI